MKSWSPSRPEWLFLGFCSVVWLVIFAYLPPILTGVDAYLFRDAAYNFLAGSGFRTASFERSTSFSPVLYSSYTPGSLWAFMAFAKVFGTGAFAANTYLRIWAVIADVVTLFAGLRFLTIKWHRWFFLIVLGIVLPVGLINPSSERPEGISFAVLLLLVAIMRNRPAIWAILLAGILGGAAFLCQPFAGVMAVFLIAGWLFVFSFGGSDSGTSDRNAGSNLRVVGTFAAYGVLAALMFALPIALTAQGFYQRDHQSLARFWKQATVAGLSREATYSSADTEGGPAKASVSETAENVTPPPQSRLQKYRDALAFHKVLGALHIFELSGVALIALVWMLLLPLAKGTWQAKTALVLAGVICFVMPVLLFPLQGSYLSLTRGFFPILLAFNWASSRTTLRNTAVIPALLIVNMIAIIPGEGIDLLLALESRATYGHAVQQANLLHEYLVRHPLNGKVVLVPATHYFMYKDAAQDIYNPGYLSNKEDPGQVGAVVNCYAGSRNFEPGTLPLPSFVEHENWRTLSAAQDALAVSLLHHKVMSRNWSMSCDIYVPQG